MRSKVPRVEILLVISITAISILLGAMLAGCQTYDAITAAPEEFWITAEEIVVAFLADLWAIVEFLL